MALRAYIGGVTIQHGLLGYLPSSKILPCSSARVQFHPSFHRATRGYTAASASLKKKKLVTAKETRKDAPLPQSPPQAAASRTRRKSRSSETAKAVRPPAGNVAAENSNPHDLDRIKNFSSLTEEQQTKEYDRMMVMAQFMSTVDPWAQEVQETLDVMIPHNVNYKSFTQETFRQIKSNLLNSFKNAAALSTLASTDSVPGITTVYRKSLWQKIRQVRQIFGTQSVEPDAFIASFRAMALEWYMLMNNAIASRDEKVVNHLTTFSYQKHALEMLKTSQAKRPNARFFWQMHRDYETRVLSLRVTQGHMDTEEPRYGNRLMIHALLKFDTEQSLEIYNQKGIALHVPASDAQKSSDHRLPAKSKRVTEYLVMEKKMWIQGPWTFREQLWPSASSHG